MVPMRSVWRVAGSGMLIRIARSTLLTLIAVMPADLFAVDDYVLGPDSIVQDGVHQGTVTKFSWTSERVYPGTVRDYWVYVPKQYDSGRPANVMVFQDGGAYVDPNGQFRTTIVFDNL